MDIREGLTMFLFGDEPKSGGRGRNLTRPVTRGHSDLQISSPCDPAGVAEYLVGQHRTVHGAILGVGSS